MDISDWDHYAIVARDLDACRHFYCDVLGMEEVARPPSFKFPGAWYRKGSAELHVIRIDAASQPPGDTPAEVTPELDIARARHHAFVVDDMNAVLERLREHNIEIVLVRTAWTDRMWDNFPAYYLTSPYCTPEAARHLVAKNVRAIGFDCFSEYCARLPDFTSEDFIIHKIILESGRYYFQQMMNLGALPRDRRFPFFAPFLKIRQGEGSPARFFALL